jgi:ABC-type amino acid transport substrate-binding protein
MYHALPITNREEDPSSRDAMLNKLRLHEVDALVLDTPAAMFMTSHAAPACDLFIGKYYE